MEMSAGQVLTTTYSLKDLQPGWMKFENVGGTTWVETIEMGRIYMNMILKNGDKCVPTSGAIQPTM